MTKRLYIAIVQKPNGESEHVGVVARDWPCAYFDLIKAGYLNPRLWA